MTVTELIEALQKLPGNAVVFAEAELEGHYPSYSPIEDIVTKDLQERRNLPHNESYFCKYEPGDQNDRAFIKRYKTAVVIKL